MQHCSFTRGQVKHAEFYMLEPAMPAMHESADLLSAMIRHTDWH
jgi:hypothetical protein